MTRANKWLHIVLATLMGTTFFTGEGCANTVAKNFNPCGTIANCDPFEYDLLWIDNTRPDYDLDPTCTVPGYCGDSPWTPAGPGSIQDQTDTGV